MTGEQNLRLLDELDQNRSFLLLAYASNPKLLAQAELRIRQLFEPIPDLATHSAPHSFTPVIERL